MGRIQNSVPFVENWSQNPANCIIFEGICLVNICVWEEWKTWCTSWKIGAKGRPTSQEHNQLPFPVSHEGHCSFYKTRGQKHAKCFLWLINTCMWIQLWKFCCCCSLCMWAIHLLALVCLQVDMIFAIYLYVWSETVHLLFSLFSFCLSAEPDFPYLEALAPYQPVMMRVGSCVLCLLCVCVCVCVWCLYVYALCHVFFEPCHVCVYQVIWCVSAVSCHLCFVCVLHHVKCACYVISCICVM